jgi:hypothetical protein
MSMERGRGGIAWAEYNARNQRLGPGGLGLSVQSSEENYDA